jgi:hypothetical protein
MKKLPIGIQTFEKIINGDFVYVDKTPIALELIQNAGYYFLSRPRRFGKSLFIDTLKEIFEGNQSLFKGLYIENKWDFSIAYPVLRINFASGFIGPVAKVDDYFKWVLEEAERDLGIQFNKNQSAIACFRELIWKAYEKYNQRVVILVDEYDKPILDNITDTEKARAIRDQLKEFYTVIKSNDASIQFVFITGVSKFAKMNLFSGLNNLRDITLSADFGNICGYIHSDLETTFKAHLEGVDLEKVRRWYNGYNYLADKVYNPFDILLFIANNKEYRNYWWSTGNPSFLIDLLYAKDYALPQVENYKTTEELLDSFDVDNIALEVLLWQTGYLTITKKFRERNRIKYQLGIPNLEIQFSLNDFFIDSLTTQKSQKLDFQDQLYDYLANADLIRLKQTFIQLFASIPYHNFTNNKIAHYEGYYASVIYAYLASLGYQLIPEDITNKGRVDLSLELTDKVYIFEFKVVEQATNNALAQIKSKKYYEKYPTDKAIYLIGIEFGKVERNIIVWEVEKMGE